MHPLAYFYVFLGMFTWFVLVFGTPRGDRLARTPRELMIAVAVFALIVLVWPVALGCAIGMYVGKKPCE